MSRLPKIFTNHELGFDIWRSDMLAYPDKHRRESIDLIITIRNVAEDPFPSRHGQELVTLTWTGNIYDPVGWYGAIVKVELRSSDYAPFDALELGCDIAKYLVAYWGLPELATVKEQRKKLGEGWTGSARNLDPATLALVAFPHLGIKRVVGDKRGGDKYYMTMAELMPPCFDGWMDDWKVYGHNNVAHSVLATNEEEARTLIAAEFLAQVTEVNRTAVVRRYQAWLNASRPVISRSMHFISDRAYKIPRPLTTRAMIEVCPDLGNSDNYHFGKD